MIALHPQIIKKEGKKEYAVVPYEEFLRIQEELAAYEDLKLLREARQAEEDAPSTSLAELKEQLKL